MRYLLTFLMGGAIMAVISYYTTLIAIRDIGLNKKFIHMFYLLISFIILDFTHSCYSRENKFIDRNTDNLLSGIISAIVCLIPIVISYYIIINRRRFKK